MIEKLYKLSHFYLKHYNREYKRYFLKKHPLKSLFYIVTGQRGVGKTTILIQRMLELFSRDNVLREALYVPVDHTYVAGYTLYDIAESFYKEGVKLICFDEIHKYSSWSRDLKSIYDVYPDLKILASGSSAMEIHKSSHDLSRRAIVYHMKGMSFREFLEFTQGIRLNPFTLEEILARPEAISNDVVEMLEKKGKRILPLFKDYIRFGYYPYFIEHQEGIDEFYLKLEQDVRKTVENDSINVYPNMSGSSIKKILKLLSLLTKSVPYTPDLNDLKRKLEIGDIRTLKQYLKFLEDGNVISTLTKKGRGLGELDKPDKIYLNNTNLVYALGEVNGVDTGSIRETFFANALSGFYKLNTVDKGDFLVNETFTFEVGGKNKRFTQVKDVKDAYLALDEIETGINRKIPLWLFGFLY
ncbi:MAG: ATP-binding protein [bacterium]|nr:ATP-binding protein [bacterium]